MKYKYSLPLSVFVFCLSCENAWAVPQLAQVAAGKAEIEMREGAMLHITAEDRSILHWEDFSLGEAESAWFQLPNSNASVLNRVVGLQPSEILGSLHSNGQIFLVNPNGILFGANAVIDTASFVASSLNVHEDLYRQKREIFFSESNGKLENKGTIYAREGDLVLIGDEVVHTGSLIAEQGKVSLVAVSQGEISNGDRNRLFIRTKGAALKDNPFAAAFTIPKEKNRLLTVEGSIASKEATLLGDWIWIDRFASVDVSSADGGGSIHIGGEIHGKSSNWENAKRVLIGSDALLNASASSNGAGGRVIIWSEEATRFTGKIKAEGGPLGGDGGFVEVSSLLGLDFQGSVSTMAPFGQIGTLLLDPNNITISSAASNPAVVPPIAFFNGGVTNPANINVTDLNNSLASNSVTIQINPAAAGGTGEIRFQNPTVMTLVSVTWNTASNLTLDASTAFTGGAGTIVTEKWTEIVPTGTGSVTLLAASSMTLAGSIQAVNGDVNLYCSGPACADAKCKGAVSCLSTSAPCTTATGSITVVATPRFMAMIGSEYSPAIGSQNGVTRISSDSTNAGCYPDLFLTVPTDGSGTVDLYTRVGYQLPGAGAAAGSIVINARNITMDSGAGFSSRFDTHIGSGDGTTLNNKNFSTNTPITINAMGNISIHTMNGGSRIGNGGGFMVGGSNQGGDISVSCKGNLSFIGDAGGLSSSRIGNGFDYNGGATATGNISVIVNGDITYTAPASINSQIMGIGHTANPTMTGNVDVFCGGSISMTTAPTAVGLTNTDTRLFIGPQLAAGSVASLTSNIRVVIGKDLTMLQQRGGSPNLPIGGTMKIGFPDYFTPVVNNQPYSGSVTVIVGGNLTMTNNSPTSTNAPVSIGYGGTLATDLFVAVGGTITMTDTLGRGAPQICSNGRTIVSAQGNISLNYNNSGATAGFPLIGNNNNAANTATLTLIRSLGSIRGTNAAATANGSVIFGQTDASIYNQVGTRTNSLIMQASGDIQMPHSFVTAGAGTVLIEADANFTSGGELWTISGGNMTSVCGINLPVATSLCPIPGTSPTTATSSPSAADGLGAFSVPSGSNNSNVRLTTNTGNITVHSAPLTTSSASAALTIDSIASTLRLTTNSGNIDISGSTAADAFSQINVNFPVTTQGSIYIRSNGDNNVSADVSSTGAGQPVSLLADGDNNGAGNLNLAANVSTSVGTITLTAGPTSSSGSSTVNQTAGEVFSSGGPVIVSAFLDVNLSGASPVLIDTSGGAGGTLDVTAVTGTISVDEMIFTGGGNGTFTAGTDIFINPPGGSSVNGGMIETDAGIMTLTANNDVVVNGQTNSLLSTSGPITVTADADNTGSGNLTINQTIFSDTGDICCLAGPGTFGCSQNNCSSGLISGFPVGDCTVDIAGGAIVSNAGSITVTSAENVIVNGLSPSISTSGPIAITAGLGDLTVFQQVVSTGSQLTTFAGNNTDLTQTGGLPLIQAAGEIRMITGLNMTLNPNTAILSVGPGDEVTLIVDNLNPFPPAAPAASSGKFTMLANSSVTSGSPLRIFTAYSQVFGSGTGVNFIDPTALLNGQSPYDPLYGYPDAPGLNSAYEQWCVFFGCPANYPFPALGVPFTIFYKVCVQLLAQQAALIVDEFFVKLHPYNEYPGWVERFWIKDAFPALNSDNALTGMEPEPYYLRRRHLNIINHPKSWTQLTPE